MNKEAIVKILDEFQAKLSEHVDSIQILISYVDDEGTHDLFTGKGNFYARQGMAREFLQRDTAQSNAVEIRKELKDEE